MFCLAATTPEADTRAWDNLPHYLSFASLALAPGQHQVTVEFRDGSGRAVPGLNKNLTVQVADGTDTVIFLSDQSVTPQTL